MATWISMHVFYILYITVVCVATNGQNYPRYVATHKLCWDASWQLVEGALYLAKLPVTADGKIAISAGVIAHVACSCQVVGGVCGEKLPRSCSNTTH